MAETPIAMLPLRGGACCAARPVTGSQEAHMAKGTGDGRASTMLTTTLSHDGRRQHQVVTGAAWSGGEEVRAAAGARRQLAVADRVADLLGGLVDPRIVREVGAMTGGDLDAVTEVVIDAKETGCLERGPEAWQLAAALPTRRLATLVGARIADLPAELLDELRLLAIGSPIAIRVAGALLDPRRIRGLEARGLARFADGRRATDEQQVTIVDAVHREVVLAGIDADEWVRLTRRLVDAVERANPEGDGLLRVARWRLQVGGWPAERFEQAAFRAYAVSDTPLARSLAARAVELGDGCREALMHAVTLTAHGDLGQAEQSESVARDRVRGPWDRARVAITEAHRHAVGDGHWRWAARELLGELEVLPAGAGTDEVRAYAALLHALDGDPVAVQRILDGGEETDEAAAGTSTEARIVGEVAKAYAAAARLDRPAIKRSAAVVEELSTGASEVPLAAELVRGLMLLEADPRAPQERIPEAIEEFGRALAGPDPVIAWWCAVLGRLHLAGGDLSAARDRFTQARLLTAGCDPVRLQPRVIADLALVAALEGIPAEAQRWLAQLSEERTRSTAIAMRCSLVGIVIAAHYAGPEEATRSAIDVGDRAVLEGRNRDAVFAWHLTARLGDPRPAAERLCGGRALPDHPAVTSAQRHAAALASGDIPSLLASAKELAAGGRYLVAAETAAVAARLSSDPVAAALAGGLASTCAQVHSPLLADIERVELSPRRREVAQAAANGVPGPRIAEELGLSLRTVNNHLTRIYRQLGVTNRRELVHVYRPDLPPLAATAT